MTRQFILTIILILNFLTSRSEEINGPANIRTEPNKIIFLSLNDNVDVDCTELKNDWFQIGITVKITQDQYEKNLPLKKGDKLITFDGKIIGEVLSDIPSDAYSSFTYGGAPGNPKVFGMNIYGYTHKVNIRENSIIENPLNLLLEKNSHELNIDNLKDFIKTFSFKKEGLLKQIFPSLTEYLVYENAIDDPSPIDRIRLIFENNILIAIIHSRPLDIKNAEDYDLVRGLKIIIFKTPKGVNKQTFIQKNKDSYNGVD